MSNTNPASTPDTWFYWVAYAATGRFGSCQISMSVPVTRLEHVRAMESHITEDNGLPGIVILSWTLLRVEDADGRVIQP